MNPSLSELVSRMSGLGTGRRMVGIAGAPGAGKSTLAESLVAALCESVDADGSAGASMGLPPAVLVPMDGFHLADVQLGRLGRRDRKGAPDTFDAYGYVDVLSRLRAAAEPVTYAPEFRRAMEEPIAGAIAVAADVPFVVTEGNYLLLDAPPWPAVRATLDEVWFLDVDEEARLARLVARHMEFGRSEDEAWARARGSDGRNALLISATRSRADLVISG